MEVFNALWDKPEQKMRPPDDNFQLFTMEEWFSMSSTHKILTGSLQCPLPQEIESSGKVMPKKTENRNIRDLLMQRSTSSVALQKKSQKKDFKEGNLYIPGLTKFPQFDRISALTFQEQADCLNLLLKFEGKPLEELSSMEKAEYQLFQSLYSRVKEEQKIYLECAKEAWPQFKTRTTSIRADANTYFKQYWVNKVTHALSQYPHKFTKIRTVSIHEKVDVKQRIHFIKNLLNIGKIPFVRLPDFDQPFRVASSILKLRCKAFLNVPDSILSGTLHKVPVSRDPNAERLARGHGANIVISTSGMRCLLDNHDENKYPPCSGVGGSWVLPIIVKEHHSFCDGKPITKTIVFIDKPLPKPKMTGFEKVSWYQKHALFGAVVDRNNPKGIQFDIKGNDIFTRKDLSSISTPGNSSEILGKDSNLSDKISSNTSELIPSRNVPSNMIETSPLTINNATSDGAGEEGESGAVDGDDVDDDDDDDDALTIDLPDDEIICAKLKPSRKVIVSDDSEIKDQTVQSVRTSGSVDSLVNSQKDASVGSVVKSDDSEIKDKTAKCEKTNGTIESVGKSLADASIRNVIKSDDSESKDQTAKSEATNGSVDSVGQNPTAGVSCSDDSVGQAQQIDMINKWEKLSAPEPVKIIDGHALPISSTNVTYNLWRLQSEQEESVQYQSHCTDGINLLIRSHVDGFEQDKDQGKKQPICLASKPDYQFEYGPSILSLSELTRQWAKLLIQPDTHLVRLRVNVGGGDLVKIEKRSILEVEEETRALYKMTLSDTLQSLRPIFTELKQLPVGQYLLAHSPQMGSTAELFRSSDEAEKIDWNLPKDYGNHPEVVDCDVQWPEIDPRIILPKHLQNQCMPCTFHCPKGPAVKSKPRKPQQQQSEAKNMNKKKKKSKKSKNKTVKPDEAPNEIDVGDEGEPRQKMESRN